MHFAKYTARAVATLSSARPCTHVLTLTRLQHMPSHTMARSFGTHATAAGPAPEVEPADVAAISRVIQSRHACREFSTKPIPEQTLDELVQLTLRSPSSFNVQPWTMVLVTDPSVKAAVADGAIAGNVAKINAAPVVAVFAADTQAYKRLPGLTKLEAAAGKPAAYVESLAVNAGAFIGTGVEPLDHAKRLGSKVLSMLAPMPTMLDSTAWAIKQTMCAATTLLYAATAHGVATAPMEGLDSRRIRLALNIPPRYEVALAVALGYEAAPLPRTARFDVQDMVRRDTFDQAWLPSGSS